MWSTSLSGSGYKVNSFTNPLDLIFELFFLINFYTIELFLVSVQLSKWQCSSLARVLRTLTRLQGSLQQLIFTCGFEFLFPYV